MQRYDQERWFNPSSWERFRPVAFCALIAVAVLLWWLISFSWR